MEEALAEARKAFMLGEVPVGAVIVDNLTNQIIARAYNQNITLCDATAHAEILAVREACMLKKSPRLEDCDLYVTLEPCQMCAAAISFAKIKRLYFAASDPKFGAIENGFRVFSVKNCQHKPEIYSGISADSSATLLKKFFLERR